MECSNCDRALLKADKFCPGCGLVNPGFKAPKKTDDDERVTRLEKEVDELKKKVAGQKVSSEVL
jgi:predicted amidophosphoribosyltransferase